MPTGLRVHAFKVPIYRADVVLLVGSGDMAEAYVGKRWGLTLGTDGYGGRTFSAQHKVKGWWVYVVWVEAYSGAIQHQGWLAHELFHITNRIADISLIPRTKGAEESRAYLFEWLFRHVWRLLAPKAG
jgi:hypothetical protein